ncbi:MlaA family lipoprotein [Nitrospira sp. Kam-Ns4a]
MWGVSRWLASAALVCATGGCASLDELGPERQSSTWLSDLLVGAPEPPVSPFAFLVAVEPTPAPTGAESAGPPASESPAPLAQAPAPAAAGNDPPPAASENISRRLATGGAPPPPADQPAAEEEFVDPFAREGEAGAAAVEVSDPWEPFNQAMFTFNRKLDEYVLKPVAEIYDKIVWDPLEFGIQNAFHNIRFVPRLLNNLFQGKVEGAGIELGRFVINSSFGIAGFFDFAGEVFELKTPDEDFGQTLGVYHVKPGPYLVIPFLGSFTLRDGAGYVVDLFLDPFNLLVFPFVTVDSWPQAVTNTDTITFSQMGIRAGYMVNERSINIDKTFEGMEKVTVDLYGAVRSAYLERRAKMIRE